MNAAGGVVVGVDGSDGAMAAVRWAAARAASTGAPLRLVYAYPPPTPLPAVPVGTPLPEPLPADYARAAEEVLASAADTARSAGEVQVSTEVVVGGPAQVLIDASREAELVVIGSRGLGGFAGLLLGSVGTQVAAHAHCPAVVVRESATRPDGPVVVGVDGSEPAAAALRLAFAEAARRKVPVVAVNAWSRPMPMSVAEAAALGIAEGFDPAAFEQSARSVLTEALEPLRRAFPDVSVRAETPESGPAAALIEASRDASIVMVGSRGRGGFVGLLLGSTSQAVLQHAHCPVLVTRAD